MKINRRQALGMAAAALPAVKGLDAAARQTTSSAPSASVKWLETAPPRKCGVSWGVPWPRNTVQKSDSFRLTGSSGRGLPLQSWTLAYWPDGSIKWTGFAAVIEPGYDETFAIVPGAAGAPATPLKVTQSGPAVDVNTGAITCRIARSGSSLIESISINSTPIARNGRLTLQREDRSLETSRTLRFEDFTSDIKKVTIEQNGPVRCVVKVEGLHRAEKGTREWLPFVVRLYFYAGMPDIRLVHSIVFDGDEHKDFIRGLGVRFDVPMREEVHNRHVRFSGEDEGLWAESLQPLVGRRPMQPRGNTFYADQLAGKRVPNKETLTPGDQKLLTDWAIWDSYKLVQPTADGFVIEKRTNSQSCWLHAGDGKRSSGYAFVGDVSGGLGVAIRNFWQSYPASLEIHNATTDAAQLTAWFWSPDAPAMDLRHYDTKGHDLDSSYEDVQPGFSTPHGVGRTSELMLFPSPDVSDREVSVQQAHAAQRPPQLVCPPEYLHSAQVFGIWSLPDRSTPYKKAMEDDLDASLAMYLKEVEQRHWYGFWDFGDVMHSYDPGRHVWRYDVGGFAWDNTELGTDMWLWYSFLRTGRADIFRMAEAMTRHTSEVDTYHLGRFAMLGSRHNVRHWGCGAKEARISQAAFRRFFYYLTGDERTGDIMHSVVDADFTLLSLDPMREADPIKGPKKYPARIRGGPDWLAFVGNWMTEWERTGNTKYRDKIMTGMDCIANMPYGFMTGPETLYGYDPKTGKMYPLGVDPFGVYNLQVIQGGAEVAFEINQLIDHPGWHKAFLQYCRLTAAPKEVVAKDMQTGHEGEDGHYAGGGRLAAYAYMETKNPAFATRATAGPNGGYSMRPDMYTPREIDGPAVLNPIEEVPMMSTNSVAQSSLNMIEVLQMCADALPQELPPAPPNPFARRG
ncbi:MAG TPA: hypothetical protein VFA65_01420 [Bryobacteraceae bacterium]|nr:hypothetical protein [Bryobacteraceae bacterium]